MTSLYDTIDSPIGTLLLVGDGAAVQRVEMQHGRRPTAIDPSWKRDPDALADVATQLEQYFAGDREVFELELSMDGNPFERRVWRELVEIPYGETASYGEIARRVGAPGAA